MMQAHAAVLYSLQSHQQPQPMGPTTATKPGGAAEDTNHPCSLHGSTTEICKDHAFASAVDPSGLSLQAWSSHIWPHLMMSHMRPRLQHALACPHLQVKSVLTKVNQESLEEVIPSLNVQTAKQNYKDQLESGTHNSTKGTE